MRSVSRVPPPNVGTFATPVSEDMHISFVKVSKVPPLTVGTPATRGNLTSTWISAKSLTSSTPHGWNSCNAGQFYPLALELRPRTAALSSTLILQRVSGVPPLRVGTPATQGSFDKRIDFCKSPGSSAPRGWNSCSACQFPRTLQLLRGVTRVVALRVGTLAKRSCFERHIVFCEESREFHPSRLDFV